MWDLPGPGLGPVSPALSGGFLTTAPSGESCSCVFKCLSPQLDTKLSREYIPLNRCTSSSAPPPAVPLELRFPEGPASWACALGRKEATLFHSGCLFVRLGGRAGAVPRPSGGCSLSPAVSSACPLALLSLGERGGQATCSSPGLGSRGRGGDQADLGPEGGGRGREGRLGRAGEEPRGDGAGVGGG